MDGSRVFELLKTMILVEYINLNKFKFITGS